MKTGIKKVAEIMDQVKWIQECGGNRAGYRVNYAQADPNVDADKIFDADMAQLLKVVREAVDF